MIIFNLYISNIKQFQVILKTDPGIYCEAMHCVRWWFSALYKWKFGVKFGICTLHWCLSKRSLKGKSWLIFTLLPVPHRESSTRWTSPCCPCFPLLVTFLPSSSTCPCCLREQQWPLIFFTFWKHHVDLWFIFTVMQSHRLSVNGICFSLDGGAARWQALWWTLCKNQVVTLFWVQMLKCYLKKYGLQFLQSWYRTNQSPICPLLKVLIK